MRLLQRVLVVLLVSAVAAAEDYHGQGRRTLPCNHTEAVKVQAAIKELGQCSDIDVGDMKAALVKQAQQQAGGRRAAVLGDLELDAVNECLHKLQQGVDESELEECRVYIETLYAKAEANDGSPGWKVASKLKNDPDTYCACVGQIDVDVGPDCTGWGVISAVKNITETCLLLAEDRARQKPQEPVASNDTTAAPSRPVTPAAPPSSPPATPPPVVPTPPTPQPIIPPIAPPTPTTKPPVPQQRPLDPFFGRGEAPGAAGGAMSELEAQAMRCYETAVHLCPTALGAPPQVLMRCAERAIRAGDLEQECFVVLESVDLTTLQLREIGGVFGTAPNAIPLNADQLACVDELLAACPAATTRGQLKRCATLGARQGTVRAACLSYLFD